VPSLHVGFACAVGVGLAATARHPVTRALSLTWGPVVALVVVATGNHYVLDLCAGVAVTLLGYGIGAFFRRLPRLPRAPYGLRPSTHAGAAQGGLHRLPPPAV
jgi:hypothetical protein